MEFANNYQINLPVLLESRLLIQANSGGGKSHALRRLLEQTAPHVQQLVIDPEGEFATLREKFDYVIAAPHDADAIASPQTAALLARPLLEAYPAALSNADLAAAAGYNAGGGAFNNPRGRLRSLGLIEYPQQGFVVARALLFPLSAQQ